MREIRLYLCYTLARDILFKEAVMQYMVDDARVMRASKALLGAFDFFDDLSNISHES